MRKIRPGQYARSYWLGISDSAEDLTYLNIYTGAEQSYSNWDVDEPRAGSAYTNGGMNKDDGKWRTYDFYDYYDTRGHILTILRTICQKGDVDVSKFDWCAAGLHDCHVDANCLPSNDKNTPYTCKCKDLKFYGGSGIGEQAPEVYRKSRGRRDAFTGSASNIRHFGALAIIFSVIAVLSIRRFFLNLNPYILIPFS